MSARRPVQVRRRTGELPGHQYGTRFGFLHAAGFYALCTLAVGWRALLGEALFNPRGDHYIAGYAFREFAARTLHATGSFPLWNPYQFGGMPYVAAMHGDIFYPTFLLRLILPTDAAMTWGFVIHVFLAGLFTYGFLRACGLGFFSALVGGAAYMLGGNVAGLVSPGHDGKLYVSALLPLTLWMIKLGMRDGKRAAWGALALVMGLVVLTPHPQLTQYLMLVAGAFTLHCAFGPWNSDRLARAVAIRRMVAATVAMATGVVIGAIQYLPVTQYVAWSPRAGGRGYAFATQFSMPPEELLNTYLPQFSGILDKYWGRNGIHLHSEYIGAMVLVLAGAAFLTARSPQGRGLARFWGWTLAASIVWALGQYTPLYHLVYALVPGSRFFRAPSTMLFVVSFCTAVLAALGLEGVLNRELSRRYVVGWIAASGLVAVAGAAGMITRLAMVIGGADRIEWVLANAGDVAFGSWRSFACVLAGGAVLLAYDRRRIGATAAGWAAAGIVGVDLWSVARLYWLFSPPASVIFASNPAIDYMAQQPEPARVVTYYDPQAGGNPRDPFLRGSELMIYGIRNAMGYHGNEIGRYDILAASDSSYYRALSDPRTWRLLNIDYWLTNDARPPLQGLTRLLGPVTDAAGTPLYLYSVPGEHPLAWVTTAMVRAPDDAVLDALLDPRFDAGSVALFDTSALVAPKIDSRGPQPPSPVKAHPTSFEPGRIGVRLESPAPEGAALVVSENYYPGWTATVDGRPANVGRADFSLIGVELPAGGRNVELTFDSPLFHTGARVTLMAIGFGLLLMAAGAIIDWRFVHG